MLALTYIVKGIVKENRSNKRVSRHFKKTSGTFSIMFFYHIIQNSLTLLSNQFFLNWPNPDYHIIPLVILHGFRVREFLILHRDFKLLFALLCKCTVVTLSKLEIFNLHT